MFYIDNRKYFTYAVGKFLDISVLNRRAENCPELPGLPLHVYTDFILLHFFVCVYAAYTQETVKVHGNLVVIMLLWISVRLSSQDLMCQSLPNLV